MPQEIIKSAAAVAKNFDDFVRILRYHGQDFKSGMSAEQTARHALYGKAGTGSIIADFGGKLFGKKISQNVARKYSNVQRKLADADIKAGHKIYSTLNNGKGGLRDKASNAFVNHHDVPLESSVTGHPDKVLRVGVPAASAPLDKAKGAALPFVGALTVGSKLTESTSKQNDKSKVGDMMEKKQNNTRRAMLIEKLSSLLCDDGIQDTNNNSIDTTDGLTKLSEMTATASKMLKFAAQENRRLITENEKLASENRKLNSEITQKTRLDRAVKLSETMNEKGMIKKADIEAQTQRIFDLDEAGYEMLKSAIENISVSSPSKKDGIDNLTFLEGTINIDIKDKRASLADSIEDAINEKKY